ncbi:MAG: helix-hairpin-helix domain-containing protein [Proteobacteria bacterium]|nr:helix-hairpin-helix domain-containing protein [Pseudomonadota bacterium]MBS0492499.1 helix-hairpin-helix domain-containing protein [Pseudomonadota bacterium]
MRLRPALLAPRLCLAALLHLGPALAATEINQAREADLDGIKGIGPALSSRILAERAKRPFRDWGDLIARVKGIKPATATRLSGDGLTVNGASYTPPEQHANPLGSTSAAAERSRSASD